jgi:hypothetical protein
MTINVSLGKVQINPEAAFVFPQSRCCNCGTTSGISTQTQDTKVTRYFMLAGTELTFSLPLPVCSGCSKSLVRRVPTLFHKFLVLAAFTAAVFLLLIVALSQISSAVPVLTDHLFISSLGISLVLVFLLYWLRRPTGQQTSYYQPVRIRKLDREFVSGAVKKIGFAFTNPLYLKDFSQANTQALQAGRVSATKSS